MLALLNPEYKTHIGPNFYVCLTQHLKYMQIEHDDITAIYIRGSRAAGNHTNSSDYDCVVVIYSPYSINSYRMHSFYDMIDGDQPEIDVTLIDHKSFLRSIEMNETSALECIFSPLCFKLEYNYTKHFRLDKFYLRKYMMLCVSARYKKFIREKTYKHLFIATKILSYGLQLINYGKIVDFQEINYIWDMYLQSNDDSKTIEHYNQLLNQFTYLTSLHISKRIDNVNYCNKLEVVEFLKNNSLHQLLEKYPILHNRHPKFNNLIQFHYIEHGGMFDENIVKECRGLILDESDNWKIISHPYTKFSSEIGNDVFDKKNIDLQKYKVYEKHDGSLAVLYFYNGQWNVSSSSVPDGNVIMCKRVNPTKFCDVFWKIFNNKKYELPQIQSTTYIFELILKDHQIGVHHQHDDLILHGARDLLTGQEICIDTLHINWKKTTPLQLNKNQMLQMLKQPNFEGFVLVDLNFNRIKIKSQLYLDETKLYPMCVSIKIGSSYKFLLNHVNLTDFKKRCPELKHNIDFMMNKIKQLREQIKKNYIQNYQKLSNNEFHETVKNEKYKIFYYQIKMQEKEKKNIEIDFNKLKTEQFVKFLEDFKIPLHI